MAPLPTAPTWSPRPPSATRSELEALKAKSAEYLEGWQRARAEFANYKRRIEKEQSETYQNATARVIGRFLDVNDDFDRAMQEKPADPNDAGALTKWAAALGLSSASCRTSSTPRASSACRRRVACPSTPSSTKPSPKKTATPTSLGRSLASCARVPHRRPGDTAGHGQSGQIGLETVIGN